MSATTLQSPASTDEAQILAVVDTLVRASYDRNAALFAAQFASDAAIFNLTPPLVHHGVDVEEKQKWMDSWSTPVGIETRDFEVTISGAMAFCHGYMRLSGTKRGAEGAVDFWMRVTLCLERAGDTWLVVHEHTSVPFYMDASLRPAFDLKPESWRA